MKRLFAILLISFIFVTQVSAAGLVPDGCKDGNLETCNLTTVEETIVVISRFLLGLAGALALLGFVVSGIRYILSGAMTKELESAKKGLVYSATGLVIALLSGVLLTMVIEALAG